MTTITPRPLGRPSPLTGGWLDAARQLVPYGAVFARMIERGRVEVLTVEAEDQLMASPRTAVAVMSLRSSPSYALAMVAPGARRCSLDGQRLGLVEMPQQARALIQLRHLGRGLPLIEIDEDGLGTDLILAALGKAVTVQGTPLALLNGGRLCRLVPGPINELVPVTIPWLVEVGVPAVVKLMWASGQLVDRVPWSTARGVIRRAAASPALQRAHVALSRWSGPAEVGALAEHGEGWFVFYDAAKHLQHSTPMTLVSENEKLKAYRAELKQRALEMHGGFTHTRWFVERDRPKLKAQKQLAADLGAKEVRHTSQRKLLDLLQKIVPELFDHFVVFGGPMVLLQPYDHVVDQLVDPMLTTTLEEHGLKMRVVLVTPYNPQAIGLMVYPPTFDAQVQRAPGFVGEMTP